MNAIAVAVGQKLVSGSKEVFTSAALFPALVLVAGLIFRGLRETPSVAGFQTVPVLLPLFVQFAILMVWLVFEYRFAANHETPTQALRRDSFLSHFLGYILFGLVAWSFFDDWLMWGFIFPMIATVADGFLTSDQSISNAAQKPLMHQSKGG